MLLNKENIQEVLNVLSEKELFFLSEEDFKFRFAIAFKQMFEGSEFIFDYQINIQEKTLKGKDKLSYIDAVISYQGNLYPLEFKYKTDKVDITEILKNNSFNISNDIYYLKKHSAHDWGHYGAMKDIWRLEKVITNCCNDILIKGFFVFLTNESLYYKNIEDIEKRNNSFKELAVGEGKIIKKNDELDWQKQDKNSKQPPAKFKFAFTYDEFKWHRFYKNREEAPYNKFKYLIVEVNK